MSFIYEILKLKGNQEVLLPLGDDGRPWVAVEGGRTYIEADNKNGIQ